MTKVNVEVNQKTIDAINAKAPWLCYDSATAFVRDAVTRRIEELATLIEN